MNEVTRVLSAIEKGDPGAAEQLLPLVYQELRRLAAQKLAQEQPGQTLTKAAGEFSPPSWNTRSARYEAKKSLFRRGQEGRRAFATKVHAVRSSGFAIVPSRAICDTLRFVG